MNMLLRSANESAGVETLWWVPLVGVVVGALLGGAAQLWAEILRARNTRKEALWKARQEAEIEALLKLEEVRFSIDETLDAVAGSAGGSADDVRQLAAVDALFAAVRKLNIQVIIIRGIGSDAVARALNEASLAVRAFLSESLQSGGITGEASSRFRAELDLLEEAVIAKVRVDLAPSKASKFVQNR